MKAIPLILTFLFLFPTISAIEFNMKQEFRQGEMLFANISGNFVKPVLEENIKFYRGHVRVPIEPHVTKLEDIYYIYAILPENNANYSIVIEDANYMQGIKLIKDDISKNFTISNKTISFSIDKGFVVTDDNFYLQVKNLLDSGISIKIKSETVYGSTKNFYSDLFGEMENGEEYSLALKSGEIKKIELELAKIESGTLKKVILSSDDYDYEIFINIFENNIKRRYIDNEKKDKETIDLDEVEELEDKQYEEEYIPQTTETCDELAGKICDENHKCEGESKYAKDAKCCLGECIEIKKNSTGMIIGWAIVLIIIFVVIWFYQKKYKGAKPKFNLLDIAKGKQKEDFKK